LHISLSECGFFPKKIWSGCQYIKGVEGRNRYHMDLFFIGDSETVSGEAFSSSSNGNSLKENKI
jgi:hypothetical protein